MFIYVFIGGVHAQSLSCGVHAQLLFVTPCTVVQRLLCPWNSPGKNTRVCCHFILWGIFLTQGLNPHLLYWQVGSLALRHLGIHLLVVGANLYRMHYSTMYTNVNH